MPKAPSLTRSNGQRLFSSYKSGYAAQLAGSSDAVSVIRTHLWEGWLLKAATDRIGTRTFASGK
jgi:hypothetical protein